MTQVPAHLLADPTALTGWAIDDKTVVTPVGRLSYPYLITPQQPNAQNQLTEPKYGTSLLFPANADLNVLMALLMRTAQSSKFGADHTRWPAGFYLPFRDQGEKQQEGYNPGSKFIVCTSNKRRPEVRDTDSVTPITDETKIYAGCWARLIVNCYDFDNKTKGFKFGLQHVQFMAHDTPLGNSVPVEGAFKPVAPAPMQGFPAQGAPTGAPAGFPAMQGFPPQGAPAGYPPPQVAPQQPQGFPVQAAPAGYPPMQGAPQQPGAVWTPPGQAAAPQHQPGAVWTPPGAAPAPQGFPPQQVPAYQPPQGAPVPGFAGFR